MLRKPLTFQMTDGRFMNAWDEARQMDFKPPWESCFCCMLHMYSAEALLVAHGFVLVDADLGVKPRPE